MHGLGLARYIRDLVRVARQQLSSISHSTYHLLPTSKRSGYRGRCVVFCSLQKSFVSHSSLVSSPAPDRPGSGSLSFYSPDVARQYGRGEEGRTTEGRGGDAVSPNKYVCFNAKLFAQRMRRAPAATQQKVRTGGLGGIYLRMLEDGLWMGPGISFVPVVLSVIEE